MKQHRGGNDESATKAGTDPGGTYYRDGSGVLPNLPTSQPPTQFQSWFHASTDGRDHSGSFRTKLPHLYEHRLQLLVQAYPGQHWELRQWHLESGSLPAQRVCSTLFWLGGPARRPTPGRGRRIQLHRRQLQRGVDQPGRDLRSVEKYVDSRPPAVRLDDHRGCADCDSTEWHPHASELLHQAAGAVERKQLDMDSRWDRKVRHQRRGRLDFAAERERADRGRLCLPVRRHGYEFGDL